MVCDGVAPGPGLSPPGEETRREAIWGGWFSPATPPVMTGVDGGVSRRPSNVRQRHLSLKSWAPAAGIVVACGDVEEGGFAKKKL